MDQNNPPDFTIQPSNKDMHSKDAHQSSSHGQPQHTITLTLTSPGGGGPGGNTMHGGGPGGQSGQTNQPSIIVSGLPNVGSGIEISAMTTNAGAHGSHQQVGMHYSGSAISATQITGNIQPKGGLSQNYIMTGQPLIVSGNAILPSSGLAGLSAVSSNPSAPHGPPSSHYGSGGPMQSSKGPSSQSYVMAGGNIQSAGGGNPQDTSDEGVPVSIHVSNNPSHESTGSGGGGGGNPPSSGGGGPPTGSSASDSHQSGQTEQRLKVEDALNYLDQVKYKFGNQPQVYNDFLDIMKEFKSQSIDTPGVISRVSNLFRGHPELIVGFNTFLPPGYKIEVQTHDQGSQVSYRVDGVTSYVVTNMPHISPSAGPISGSGPAPAPVPVITTTGNTSQIIQHTTTAGGTAPIRSTGTPLTHSTHAPTTLPSYGNSSIPPGGGGGNVSNLNSSTSLPTISITANGRSISPPAPISQTPISNTTYEGTGGTGPTFTHSFSSPFVQNAFPSLQSQPVEFNHAINYVNKIKNRFCGQPDKYKQFLEILHTYQKEQRHMKEGLPPSAKHLTEHEVYSQVAKLFENQEDLLQEFGQFLPDATNPCGGFGGSAASSIDIKPIIEPVQVQPLGVSQSQSQSQNQPPAPSRKSAKAARAAGVDRVDTLSSHPLSSLPANPRAGQTSGTKRQASGATHPLGKKPKLATPYKDVSFAEAARYGTLHDYSFFDKVRAVLKNQEVYENFLRCLVLFNEEVISRQELLTVVQPFFSKAPEMYAWLKEFVNMTRDEGCAPIYEPVAQHILKQSDKLTEEQALEIDFSTCKRLGASYCALPKNHIPTTCSGRTPLCKETLNDVWVSFPTWSEDSTFVTSRKTQYEEYICRCEDERFELDVIIEANADTIRTFEAIARKMARMTPEELARFELEDNLGGTSLTIHQRTVKRVYGDKAPEVIEGLKKQPYVVVPIVLRRLKVKEEEWRESQKNFNKIWREQVERFYLKSLDHQGITFKQSDIRALRSKSLINEIETVFDERHDQEDDESDTPIVIPDTPHLTLQYGDRSVLDDACNLLLHHVRRQSGIQNDDKRKIKQLLKHFIPDMFRHTRMELSDDEHDDPDGDASNDDEDRRTPTTEGKGNGNKRGGKRGGNSKASKKDDDEEKATDSASNNSGTGGGKGDSQESRRTIAKRELQQKQNQAEGKPRRRSGSDGDMKKDDFVPLRTIQVPHSDQDETYTLFYGNNTWYVFLRLHHILCERLSKMLDTASKLLQEERKAAAEAKMSHALALRMRATNDIEVQDYYPTFLDMVKNLLDGNMEPCVYEDTMREMFGISAYISYTMDKVVANAVRQLQTLVADEYCLKFMELLHQAQRRGGAGGICDTAELRAGPEMLYQKYAEKVDPEENCYKVYLLHKSCKVTMELLEGSSIDEDSNELAKWSAYIDNYTNESETGMDGKVKEKIKPVYLPRNIKKWKKIRQNAYTHFPEEIAQLMDPSVFSGNRRESFEGSDSSGVRRDSTDASISSRGGNSAPLSAKEIEEQLEENARRRAERDSGAGKSPYIIKENLQCKFNPHSYKMVFVVNSENYFYLKGALKRAKENHEKVTKGKDSSFGKWHQAWLDENTTSEQMTRCEDWLLSPKTSNTKVISSNDVSKSPYRPFNKYAVAKK